MFAFVLVMCSLSLFSLSHRVLYVFLLPTLLYVATMLVSGLNSFRGSTVTESAHRDKVANWLPDYFSSVDVFLPSAGEPIDVLRNTYSHVKRLSWPGTLRVYVLDDSGRPEVAALAREHGFAYRSRPDRGYMKKAGNLKYGYEHSDGDYIVVLDADFVPRHDFLYDLMPYFDDGRVAIVQSPQFFDTHGRMQWLQRHAGSTQEMFYRWIQSSRDEIAAAICVGTCAVYRRSAMEVSGGFAQIGHSEDVHTGVELMKVGFRVKYVPVIVSKGICPDTYSAFVNQQYRWCSGSMSLLRNPTFHRNPAITARQRLSFFSGFLYYISTAVNIVLAPLPPLLMLFFFTDEVRPQNTVWLLGSTAMWLLVYPLVHKSHWTLTTMRVRHIYSWAHLLSIVNCLTGTTKGWVATGAAGKSTPISTSVTRLLVAHGVVAEALMLVGLARGIEQYGPARFWAMALVAVANAYVVLPTIWLAFASSPGIQRILKRRTRQIVLPEPQRVVVLPQDAAS